MTDQPARAPRQSHLVGAALLTGALLLGGCGTGGSSSAAPPTTAPDDAANTTTDPETTVAPDPTTATTEPSDELTMDDLAAILPTAEGMGPEFEEGPPPELETFLVAAVGRQCPDGVDFLGATNDDGVGVMFTAPNGSTLDFRLSLPDQTPDAAELEALVETINDCDTVGITNSNGSASSVTLAAGVEESLGDQAMRVGMSLSTQAEGSSESLSLNTLAYIFWIDDIRGELRFGEGSEDGERIEIDPAALSPIVREIEERVQTLADR